MTKKTARILLGTIAMLGIVISASMAVGPNGFAGEADADKSEMKQPKSILLHKGVDAALSHGYNSALVISSKNTHLTASSESPATATFEVTHKAGSNPVDSIAVEAEGVTNTIIPASVLETTTEQERVNQLKNQGHIFGAVDLTPMISFEPKSFNLAPRDTQTVKMHINIPLNLNPELLEEKINFQPGIKKPASMNHRRSPFSQTVFK